MSDINIAFQKLKRGARAKAKKVNSQSEDHVSDTKPKGENVEDMEREEAKKNETNAIIRVHTAPAKLGNPKDTADEWDASKTPPSRFQQRKGSVYATPNSRDSHIDRNADRDAKFHELHDKKFGSGKTRSGSSRSEACFGAVFQLA